MTEPLDAASPEGAEPAADPVVSPDGAPAADGGVAPAPGGDAQPAEPAAEPAPKAGDWPDNWRDLIAGDDEKFRKQLDRIASPSAMGKSWLDMRSKLSAGKAKGSEPLAADASPEDVAAWREANGIPKEASGYLDALPGGVVLGDAERELASGFASEMHALNAPPELVGKAIAWHQARTEEALAQQFEGDKAYRAGAEDELRGEWGAEFRTNQHLIANLLDSTAPSAADGEASLKDQLFAARGPDGRLIGDNPEFLRWMVNIAREVNPAGTIVPEGGSSLSSIADEIAGIQKVMRENRAAYNKDKAMQQRLHTLLTAQEKLAARG